MPSKKKKYNARFPAGRIKKIMQSDEEVGKVAQAVPIIISRTLELFVESLLEKTLKITTSRNAKTLSPSHMKQCIMAENRFDFLRELVKNIPDISVVEESGQDISPGPSTPSIITSGTTETTTTPITPTTTPPQQPFDLSMPSTSCNQIFDGQLFDIKNGGGGRRNQPRSCNGLQYSDITTTIHQQINISPTISSSTSTATSTTTSTPISPTTECRKELKRQWDTVHATRQTNHAISANFYKEQNNNSDNSLETDSDDDTKLFVTSPTKLRRMESTPNNIGSKTGNKSSKAAKKRFHHRSKSIPSNINDQNHHKLINSNLRRSATLTTSQKQQLPAPIVNIDTICNRPIVKIDYSNLDLNDKDPIESASISLSKSQTTTASPSSLSLSSLSTSTSLSSPSSSSMPIPLLVTPAAPAPATAPTNISPIINIDLSKLVTTSSIIPPSPSSSSSSSSLSSSSISMKNLFHNIVAGGEKSTTIQQTKLPTKLGSTTSLELDEDYDNI